MASKPTSVKTQLENHLCQVISQTYNTGRTVHKSVLYYTTLNMASVEGVIRDSPAACRPKTKLHVDSHILISAYPYIYISTYLNAYPHIRISLAHVPTDVFIIHDERHGDQVEDRLSLNPRTGRSSEVGMRWSGNVETESGSAD